MKRRALGLTAALLVGVAAASLVAGDWLTQPVRSTVGAPPPGAQVVRIEHGGGQHLAGWLLPGRPGRGALLLLHGVRGNRLQMLARAQWLQREGINCLIVDLPAHGESSGEHIGFGRLEAPAVDAGLAWLRQRMPGEKVGAIGVSLGGAALLFASRQPALDALVLESVYPTLDDAVRNRLAMHLGTPLAQVLTPLLLAQVPWRLGIGSDRLRPIEAIGTVGAPLLVASGTDDIHTPWRETEALFAAAPRPKTLWAVPGAAHVDLHAHGPSAYEARLGPWLQAHLAQAPTPP